GILDENDLVAHQLAGAPQMVTLGQLLRERRRNCFDLFRVPPAKSVATLVFGGDVMLGRSCAEKIENGTDPFSGVAPVLRGASFAAANLECTISNLGDSTQRYAFRAPARSAQLLRDAGFHAMGLANNHALDFGTAALHDCAACLSRQKIEPVGLGILTGTACSPSFFSVRDGKQIALIAISDVGPAAESEIATAADRARLSDAIASARSPASLVACMVHWGIENTANITDEQRELARWLVDHGVDLVVGSHPHCVQPLDFYHGCPIAYSLGNLVFDGAPTVASWNHSALLEVTLDGNAKVASASLIPLILEAGLPRMDRTTSETGLGNAENFPSSAAAAP
ncbi:MAG TPA: CapA family protein, partial [Candidatus Udaeobacter sp.]|nr:CapA family protein [Candidatus Udaeobacter sp.]